MQLSINGNIFCVFIQTQSKKRLVTTDGKVFELGDQLTAPHLEESEFANIASMFQRPDLSFLSTFEPSQVLQESELSELHSQISNSNFFKAYKGGKNLGVMNPAGQEVTLWIFNDVLTSTWKAKGDQELEGIAEKVLGL